MSSTLRPRLRHVRRALGCALALLLVGCGVPAVSAPDATRSAPATFPRTTTDPTTATAATTAPATGNGRLQIGLSYGDSLTQLSDAQLDSEFDDAVTLGANWVRIDVLWADVQPDDPSTFQWADIDRTVQAARSRGLTVLPILNSTPAWARQAGCTTEFCGPADPSQFAAFAAAAARRYAPQGVHTWEIWNEPNIVNFWQPTADPAAYVALLRATTPAIRAADPTATLISGGLAPAPSSGGSIGQLAYLAAFARLGGLALVDAVGYHPFSFPVPPEYNSSWNAWNQITGTATSFRSILAANGAAGKKLWLTEYGAPTNGPGAVATTDDYNITHQADHVDEAYQAALATDAVAAARRAPGVAALFWYSDRDEGTSRVTAENFFGLRRYDGTAKPAFAALKAAIAAASRS